MSERNDDREPAGRLGQPPTGDFSDGLESLVRSIYEENEKITLGTAEDIIGDAESVVNKRYDQQSEQQIEARWQASERKASSDVIGTRGNNDFPSRNLWNFCLRFMGQAPPMMLSPLHCLQFVPVQKSVLTSHLFSHEVCMSLARLIVHPVWEQNHYRFIDTLLYAANYHVGALQNFRWTFFTEDGGPAWEILNNNLMAVGGPQLPNTVHELHVDARNTVIARGETPGVFSDLLCRIGEIATVSRSPSSTELERLKNGVVPFNGRDLEVMEKAIDSMASTEPKIGYPVQVVYGAFKAAKDTNDALLKRRLREFDAQTQQAVSQPASSIPSPGRVSRRSQSPQDSNVPSDAILHTHISRPSSNRAINQPQDSIMVSDQRSMRQGYTTVATLDPVPHPRAGMPLIHNLHQRRGPGQGSHVDRGVAADDVVPAHDDFVPMDMDDTPRSREPVRQDSLATPHLETPDEATLGLGLAMDEIRQLRQDNAHLRQQLEDEILKRHQQINNLKTDQALALAAFQEFKAEQARVIDDLKARLETRETEARRFSERLAELEARRSETDRRAV
ncbi:hypothetical protein FCIRC_12204 [Fusarium circinatum]|uniref:Uncharacterized protein n=1 Tax=Fusarium circinatum TaxID=48490 RepID=A0A8H5WHJ0_FUSCI|nr:hypothetical protein FCIRC_12204 [Fusarium circinatum]